MTQLGAILSNASVTSADISDFGEAVQDVMGATLVAGTNMSVTYNDAAGTITLDSAGGGGGGFVSSVADTNTLDLTVTGGGQLSGVIPTTATPTIASMTLSNVTLTTSTLVDDQGDELKAFHGVAGGPVGRWRLVHGSITGPYTTEQPSLVVQRTQSITTPAQSASDAQWHTAIAGIARGNVGDRTMVTGLVGAAHQFSTTGTSEADACGVWGIGAHHGVGAGLGAYLEGRIADDATSGTPGVGARARAIELRTSNYETTPTDSPYVASPYSDNKMNALQASVLIPNDPTKLGGSGYIFYRPNTTQFAQYDVGIACTSTNTPIRNAFLRDDGGSLYSYLINGTHATAAIAIASGAGKFLVGATSTGFATTALIKSNTNTDAALTVQAPTSPSVSPLTVVSSTGTEWVSVGTTGNLRVLKELQLEGAGGAGVMRLFEQTAAPGTPSAGRFYLYGRDNGSGKQQIVAKWDDGVISVVATQP